MNKKIKHLFLAGVVIFGLAGVAVSCKDYDDDIDRLEEKTDNLEKQVNDLTTKLDQAKADVTGLQSSLSTLQKTVDELKAGAANSATKSELEAAVKDLEGKIAAAKNETVAEALKQAKAYADELKKAVDEVLGGKVDKTAYDAQVKKLSEEIATLTGNAESTDKDLAAIKADIDSLKKAVAGSGDSKAVEDLSKKIEDLSKKFEETIASLVSQQLYDIDLDSQAYVDGVPAIIVKALNAKYVSASGEKGAEKVEGADDVALTSDITASYYLKPSNAKVTEDFKFEYIIGDVPFYATRSGRSKDFSITPKFNSVKDGRLNLDLSLNGAPAEGDSITKIRLKVTEGADTSIISDEHTIYRNVLGNVVIANKNANKDKTYKGVADRIYRNNYNGVGTVSLAEADGNSYAPVNANPIWNELYDLENNVDTVLVNGEKLDLKGILAATSVKNSDPKNPEYRELTEEELEKFHLSWKVELVNYPFADKATDSPEHNQAEYVKLSSDSTFLMVNEAKSFSANGRTPIIRASLVSADGKPVAIGYVKVGIKAGKEGLALNPSLDNADKETNTFQFDCANDETWVKTTPDQITEITKEAATKSGYESVEAFSADYPNLADAGEAAEGKIEKTDVEGKTILKWTISMAYAWEHAGEVITRNVEFRNADGKLAIPVTLKANVAKVIKATNIPIKGEDAKAHYIDEFWFGPDRGNAEGFDLTKFNVIVPDEATFNPDNCKFESGLNVPFKTDKSGAIVLDLPKPLAAEPVVTRGSDEPGGTTSGGGEDGPSARKCPASGYTVKYFFSGEVANIKDVFLDGKAVTFKPKEADNTVLQASVDGTTWEDIATIDNAAAAPKLNVISLNKESELAKKLLNTDKLYTYIGASAYYCCKDEFRVDITFNGKAYYRGDFIRPIYATANLTDGFTDGVNIGAAGSYLVAEKLVNPYDWRGFSFEKNPKLWDYYGPVAVSVNPAEITCHLGGANVPVPANIELKWETANPWNNVPNEKGMLTYHNNGSPVSDFKLYVPVTVTYS